jgi:hypothetical protein
VFLLLVMSDEDDRIDHHLQRLRELREFYDATAHGRARTEPWRLSEQDIAGEFVQALDLAIAYLVHKTGP